MLSDQATSIWAKTGGSHEWLPLSQHLLDSVHVAGLLFDQWRQEDGRFSFTCRQ